MEIFKYNTLKVFLEKKTKSLFIHLSRDHQSKNNLINVETIFELESLLSWTAQHIEINTIVIQGQNNFFSKGFDLDEFAKLPDKRFQNIIEKFQKVIYSMFFLPQTIIANLQGGGKGPGLELAIGADIRIACSKNSISFDHLKNAIIPSCGGVGFLSQLIPSSYTRNWLLSPDSIKNENLLGSGFIHSFYEDNKEDEFLNQVLEDISKQSPISRIQTKRSLLEAILPELDRTLTFEKKFANAGMALKDWKRQLEALEKNEIPEFLKAKDLGNLLKKERHEEAH
ncbi:MAG: enoyl-CoA hydratase/isomerase family protein [Bdellovibrionota bacterium]|nr:enoyl-CoA hydratase/isomerase family protein [Bdellovibrionota bacterium]